MRSQSRQATLLQSGYRYASALSGDPDVARDLVHDAWLSLLSRHGQHPDRALFFRAIRHRHIDDYRRRRRSAVVDFDEQDVATHRACEGTIGIVEPPDPALARALTELRDVERESLLMSVIEGYTASEIGELTNQPRNTVLSHLHRARKRLKVLLASPDEDAVRRAGTATVIPLEQRGDAR